MAVKKQKGVQESLDFIIKHMLTKDDVREIVREIIRDDVPRIVHEETRGMRADIKNMKEDIKRILEELKDVRRRLDALEKDTRNHAGFAKEIDYALQRLARIEKHLGLSTTPSK